MEMYGALDAFLSLCHETRHRVFKLLLEFGHDGLVAGKIAEKLKIADNTLSFHLAQMVKTGLITSKKKGRSITYFANTAMIEDLIEYLVKNCCIQEKKTKRKAKSPKVRKCFDEKISSSHRH